MRKWEIICTIWQLLYMFTYMINFIACFCDTEQCMGIDELQIR